MTTEVIRTNEGFVNEGISWTTFRGSMTRGITPDQEDTGIRRTTGTTGMTEEGTGSTRTGKETATTGVGLVVGTETRPDTGKAITETATETVSEVTMAARAEAVSEEVVEVVSEEAAEEVPKEVAEAAVEVAMHPKSGS